MPCGTHDKCLSLKITASTQEYRFFAQLGSSANPELVGGWVEFGMITIRAYIMREMMGPIFSLFANAANEDAERVEVVFSDFTVDRT